MNTAPINEEQLSAEWAVGETVFLNVPASQTHLAALTLAAMELAHKPGTPVVMQEKLIEFNLWCSRHAGFGVHTRRLIAQWNESLREGRVQTPGHDTPEGP